MVSERTVKSILFIGFLIALTVYHGLSVLHDKFLSVEGNNWSSLMTIARILVTTILVFITLKLQWLVKLFLGSAYVADAYKGISRQSQNPNTLDHYEDFTVTQSILWTRISGRTHLQDGSVVSNYSGKLVEYDDDKGFKFLIDLQTSTGAKLGILTLRFDSGTFSGFYFPTETHEANYISTVEGETKALFEKSQKQSPAK